MNTGSLPKHVAIIMDGNGRWAKRRKLNRSQGHIEGVKRVEEIIGEASEMGIKVLTLYTFSTENWKRPPQEILILMRLLTQVLNKKTKQLVEKNIKFQIIGRESGIPQEVLKRIKETIEKTKNNTGMILNMAFNYGGRIEILDAVKKVAQAVRDGAIGLEDITELAFSQALYTKALPDPDLLIRTSGEKRLSNFLLWQLSYSELYFTDKYWPDFNGKEFKKAMQDYGSRDRRYGRVVGETH